MRKSYIAALIALAAFASSAARAQSNQSLEDLILLCETSKANHPPCASLNCNTKNFSALYLRLTACLETGTDEDVATVRDRVSDKLRELNQIALSVDWKEKVILSKDPGFKRTIVEVFLPSGLGFDPPGWDRTRIMTEADTIANNPDRLERLEHETSITRAIKELENYETSVLDPHMARIMSTYFGKNCESEFRRETSLTMVATDTTACPQHIWSLYGGQVGIILPAGGIIPPRCVYEETPQLRTFAQQCAEKLLRTTESVSGDDPNYSVAICNELKATLEKDNIRWHQLLSNIILGAGGRYVDKSSEVAAEGLVLKMMGRAPYDTIHKYDRQGNARWCPANNASRCDWLCRGQIDSLRRYNKENRDLINFTTVNLSALIAARMAQLENKGL